jgi:hypothetical protein
MKATIKDRLKALAVIAYTVIGNYRAYSRRLENAKLQCKVKGATLHANATAVSRVQDRCNHRKGGRLDFHKSAASGVVSTFPSTGEDHTYAVIKHTMLNGDTWVKCLRCAKTWKPGDPEYPKALGFLTNNQSSSSIRFQFSDGGKAARMLLRNA